MKLIHLVYIHGFQGNDTTFQSFPTHLHKYLTAQIPSHLDIEIKSSLYPTYKSAKPISYATKNFLEWLTTQPPGPVILLGHSMGGLLAAEAATDLINNPPDRYPGAKPLRIMGVVAFDTPYLGMHPHVVISGIASLLPKDKDNGKGKGKDDEPKTPQKTETEMNPHHVQIVDSKVTDDWENVKKEGHMQPHRSSGSSSTQISALSDEWEKFKLKDTTGARSRPTSLTSEAQSYLSSSSSLRAPSPSSLSSPRFLAPPRHPSSHSLFQNRSISPPPPRPPSPFMERALNYLSARSNDPLVRWVRKHADDPLGASKTWVIEHFQFGVCMFDPSGLKERYARLVSWGSQGGVWVNYWTQTVPRVKEAPGVDKESENQVANKTNEDQVADNDLALVETGIANLSVEAQADPKQKDDAETKQTDKERDKEMKKLKKKRASEGGKMGVGRHFIVLPTGLGQVLGGLEKWEKVVVKGVTDEVAAHTGLFIPHQNVEYEDLVEKVGQKILGWCERL